MKCEWCVLCITISDRLVKLRFLFACLGLMIVCWLRLHLGCRGCEFEFEFEFGFRFGFEFPLEKMMSLVGR